MAARAERIEAGREAAERIAHPPAARAGARSCRSPAARRIYARLFLGAHPSTTGRPPAARRCSPGRSATSSSAATSCPDDMPLIGGLDDLVVVVLAVDLFLDGVPDDVLDEKLDELGIDRRAFERGRRADPAVHAGPAPPAVRRMPELVAARSAIRWSRAASDRGSGPGSTRRSSIA